MRKRGLWCRPVSVCPTRWWTHTAEDIVKLLVRPGSLVFDPMRRYSIPRGTPSAGDAKYTGWGNVRFSTEITVYLGNGSR